MVVLAAALGQWYDVVDELGQRRSAGGFTHGTQRMMHEIACPEPPPAVVIATYVGRRADVQRADDRASVDGITIAFGSLWHGGRPLAHNGPTHIRTQIDWLSREI